MQHLNQLTHTQESLYIAKMGKHSLQNAAV